ncbi:hypothetical protein [Bifidobacterium olomucense]|nr:hypothetical protein [Bifidobacterium sp. DSM 109959]
MELAVSDMLVNAYDWITEAVKATNTDPLQAKSMRAYVYTIEEATKQRDLSKSIQLDAQEMARRADYALGKAIRDGQANGTVTSTGTQIKRGNQHKSGEQLDKAFSTSKKISAYGLFPSGDAKTQAYEMVDNASPEEFDTILAEAHAEGNLSRANVSRKAKSLHTEPVDEVIDVDPATGEIREPHCPKRTVEIFNTIIAGATPSLSVLSLIDWNQIPSGQAVEWHAQLSEAIKSLQSLNKRLSKVMK